MAKKPTRTPKTMNNDPLGVAFAKGKVAQAQNGLKKFRKKRIGPDKSK